VTARSTVCTNATDSASLLVAKAAITSVDFTSDHNLLLNNNTDWTDSGARYPSTEWIRGSTTNSPISQTKNTSLVLKVKVTVCPAGVTFNLNGSGGDAYTTFVATNIASTGADQEVTLTANAPLPNQIATLAKSISWTVTVNGLSCASDTATSGPHKIYVTYGTPAGSAVTERRMAWTVTKCDGEITRHGCVTKIHDGVGNYNLNRAIPPDPLWLIAGGDPAQCYELAGFYGLATHLIGITGGDVVYIYPKLNKTVKETLAQGDDETRVISSPPHLATTTHNDVNLIEVMGFADMQGGVNHFEACFKFTAPAGTKYYAGGAGIYNTSQEVMNAICDKTFWLYLVGFVITPTGVVPQHDYCTSPGPNPAEDW
jgi:hypothetical protein